MSIANIIIGLIFGAAGAAFIVYAYPLNKKILFLSWVEQKWGMGTGPTAYKMLGLFCIILGICSIIGWVDLATPILGKPQPPQSSVTVEDPANRTISNNVGRDLAP
jgi:hypothetical protein